MWDIKLRRNAQKSAPHHFFHLNHVGYKAMVKEKVTIVMYAFI